MARRSFSSFKKRQKEMARKERRQEKLARRRQRKEAAALRTGEEDPNTADIRPSTEAPADEEL